jgi:hypothetical protein
VRFIVNPAPEFRGDRDREEGAAPAGLRPPAPLSPIRTKVSIDFSRLPPSALRIAIFLCSSLKPISRSFAIFKSSSSESPATEVPITLDCLFLGGDGVLCPEFSKSDCAAARRFFEESGKMEDADLKPNLLPVLGGRGGGWSSEFVLPVLFRSGALTVLSIYFCRINLSIAESASSTSNGIGGFAF